MNKDPHPVIHCIGYGVHGSVDRVFKVIEGHLEK